MAPSYSASKNKGKSRDQSTQWSDWVLDNQNCYYRWRINSSGLEERYYENAAPDDTIPRSLGPDTQESYSMNTTSSNSVNSDNYTTSYNTIASQQSYSHDPSQSTGFSSPQSYYNQDTTSGNFGDTTGTHSISESEPSYYSATNTQNDSVYDNGSSSQSRQRHGSNLGTITQGLKAVKFQEQDHLSPKIPTPKKISAPKHRTKLERLSDKYQTIPEKEQKKFWKQGRVFMMLWAEPAANPNPKKVPEDGGTRDGSHISTTWLEGRVYSEIRRFVVVREGYGNNICCPIQTYSGQATLKPGLPDPHQHAIIYTSSEPPGPHSITRDGVQYTEQLTKLPIKVNRYERGPEGDLGKLSRLNYSKLYTVENYVRVLNIGMVHKDWLPILDANSLVKSTKDEPIGRPRDDIRKG